MPWVDVHHHTDSTATKAFDVIPVIGQEVTGISSAAAT